MKSLYLAAMGRIVVDTALLTDPRLTVLGQALAIKPLHSIGVLVALWSKTRTLKQVGASRDELLACLPGSFVAREIMLQALVQSKFIETDDDALFVVVDDAAHFATVAKRKRAGQASGQARRAPKVPAAQSQAVVVAKPRAKPNTQANKACWDAYCAAYMHRYNTAPVSNQQARGMVATFVKQVGQDVAPELARWYVGHPSGFYLKNTHSFKFLLSDAATLLTQYKNNMPITHERVQRYVKKQDSMAERLSAKMIDSGN